MGRHFFWFSPDKSLKVPLRGTFKLLSGCDVSAKRCKDKKCLDFINK